VHWFKGHTSPLGAGRSTHDAVPSAGGLYHRYSRKTTNPEHYRAILFSLSCNEPSDVLDEVSMTPLDIEQDVTLRRGLNDPVDRPVAYSKSTHFEVCPNLSREAEHWSELGKHILMLVWIDQAGKVLTTLGFR
jgi:hypothetical protein